jgi:hypothetical protein
MTYKYSHVLIEMLTRDSAVRIVRMSMCCPACNENETVLATPWGTFLVQKLTVAPLSVNSPLLMKPEGYSQEPVAWARWIHFTLLFVFKVHPSNVHLRLSLTERSGRLVNTPASYTGGPGLNCRHGDRLSRLRLFVVYLSSFRQMLG